MVAARFEIGVLIKAGAGRGEQQAGGFQAAALRQGERNGLGQVAAPVHHTGESTGVDQLVQLLGSEPKKYCAPSVAHDLAAAAFERARALREANGPAIGVGCTAALRSEPMKRGAHRCFVAVRTEGGTHELALTLAKGARSRQLHANPCLESPLRAQPR